jgi:3-(3-hydroxy-phenyl)propionate hydroxylase
VPTALVFVRDRGEATAIARDAAAAAIPGLRVVAVADRDLGALPLEALVDRQGLARARYGGAPGVTYLIRPDQHVLGRWNRWDPAALGAAWRDCLGGAAA